MLFSEPVTTEQWKFGSICCVFPNNIHSTSLLAPIIRTLRSDMIFHNNQTNPIGIVCGKEGAKGNRKFTFLSSIRCDIINHHIYYIIFDISHLLKIKKFYSLCFCHLLLLFNKRKVSSQSKETGRLPSFRSTIFQSSNRLWQGTSIIRQMFNNFGEVIETLNIERIFDLLCFEELKL